MTGNGDNHSHEDEQVVGGGSGRNDYVLEDDGRCWEEEGAPHTHIYRHDCHFPLSGMLGHAGQML